MDFCKTCGERLNQDGACPACYERMQELNRIKAAQMQKEMPAQKQELPAVQKKPKKKKPRKKSAKQNALGKTQNSLGEAPAKKNRRGLLWIALVAVTALAVCAGLLWMDDTITKEQNKNLPQFIAADYDKTGTCGENAQWGFKEATGELTIIGTGKMENYTSKYDATQKWNYSTAPWGQFDVKTVRFYGVTTIGAFALYGSRGLTEAEITDSVTTIEGDAFAGCDSLISIVIPDSVTTIEGYAFAGCDSLISIVIPDGVTTIKERAFYNCYNLTEVKLPDTLTSIWNSTFDQCRSLPAIEIPDSVTTIGFQAFYSCESMTSVKIPDGVTDIRMSAFANCENLESIEVSDSVVSIGDCAFDSCDRLTSAKIGSGVTTIGGSAFSGCYKLIEIKVDKDNPNYMDLNGTLMTKDQTTLLWYPAGKSQTEYMIPDGVTTIGERAFTFCNNLTEVIIPDGVTTIGECAFTFCNNLTEVIIPDSVTVIGEWALASDSLTDVYYSGTEEQWNTIEMGEDAVGDATIHYNS